MSLYHFTTKLIGRTGGLTALGAAAYRATCKIHDEELGINHDYSRKQKALHSEIVVNESAPTWASDREKLWNEVHKKENRSNSQLCREYELALQSELTLEQNIQITRNFIKNNFTKLGLVADFSIHAPHKFKDGTDNKNIHAHILVTTRAIENGEWKKNKFRAEDLPKVRKEFNTEKINGKMAEQVFLKQLRENWQDTVNYKFMELDINARIDCRTLQAQGIDREPTQHMGVTATAIQRKGKEPRRTKYKPVTKKTEIETLRISISDKEIYEEFEKNPEHLELLKLQTQVKKIENMSLDEWEQFIKHKGKDNFNYNAVGEFEQNIRSHKAKAETIYIEQNIKEITKIVEDETYQAQQKAKKKIANKPTICEKPKVSFLYKFTADNNKIFNNYDDYKREQNHLLNTWNYEFKPLEKDYNQKRKLHKACVDKDYKEIKNNLFSIPKLAEKVKIGAKKLYEESPLFAPIRRFQQAVEMVKIKKDAEIDQRLKERELERKTKNNDRGMSR